MRLCTKCGVNKLLSEFYVRNKQTGQRHRQCKECYALQRIQSHADHYELKKTEYQFRAKSGQAKRREAFRQFMMQYLTGKNCVDCGESNPIVLEFDHLDPSQKSFTIAHAVRLNKSLDDVKKEISLCELVCSNCHKIRTARQFGWYKVK